MRSWFIWNDIDSRAMGVILESEPSLQRAKERVSQVAIAGRSGMLTLTEGDGIYDGYIQSVSIAVKGQSNMRHILKWLSGDGYVTFSNDSIHRQKARIINAMTFTRVSPLLDYYKGQAQFYCDPYKEDIGESVQTVTSSAAIVNVGDIAELPLIEVIGSGNITLTVNDKPFALTGIVNGCIVDCEACEVLSLDGKELITTRSSGAFPSFDVGRNSFAIEGGAANIHRRQRYL